MKRLAALAPTPNPSNESRASFERLREGNNERAHQHSPITRHEKAHGTLASLARCLAEMTADPAIFDPPPDSVAFYTESLQHLVESGIPFMLSGTYALILRCSPLP